MPITSLDSAACAKCRYFDAESSADSLGLCRYNPPISQPSADAHGIWPKVEAEDWCGHFEATAA